MFMERAEVIWHTNTGHAYLHLAVREGKIYGYSWHLWKEKGYLWEREPYTYEDPSEWSWLDGATVYATVYMWADDYKTKKGNINIDIEDHTASHDIMLMLDTIRSIEDLGEMHPHLYLPTSLNVKWVNPIRAKRWKEIFKSNFTSRHHIKKWYCVADIDLLTPPEQEKYPFHFTDGLNEGLKAIMPSDFFVSHLLGRGREIKKFKTTWEDMTIIAHDGYMLTYRTGDKRYIFYLLFDALVIKDEEKYPHIPQIGFLQAEEVKDNG